MTERANHVQNLSSLFSNVLQQLNMSNSPEWLQLDLTFQQMKVLYILRQEGPLKMTQLHEKLGVTMPTITGIVNRLIERRDGVALLVRETSPDDRRQVWARLTPEGLEVTEMLNQLNSKLLEQALSQMNEAEVQGLESNLTHFLNALNVQREKTESLSSETSQPSEEPETVKVRRTNRRVSNLSKELLGTQTIEHPGNGHGVKAAVRHSYGSRPILTP